MKRKKILALTIACVLSALTFTACGSKEDTSTSGGNTSSGNKVEISFLHKYCQPDQAPLFVELCKQYEKDHPNVKINIETVPDDQIKDKLRVALGGGAIPDIYQTWSGEYAKKFIRGGATLDITKYLDEDKAWKDAFLPAALNAYKVDGKNYAIPTRFDSQFFVYNKQIFDKYGLTKPKTWDDLMKIAETLKSNGVTPFVLGNQLPWDAPHWFGALFQKYVPEDVLEGKDFEVKTVSFTDPGYVTALQTFKGLLDKKYFTPNINSNDHNMGLQMWYSGKGAMIYLEFLEFWDVEKNMKGNWDFFPMPEIAGAKGNQSKIFGGPEGLMVYSKTKNPDVAVDVLKWLTNKENETRKVSEIGHSSSVIGAINEKNSPKQAVEALDYILKSKGLSEWTDCAVEARIVDVLLKTGQDFINGTISPEDYMKKVQETAKEVQAQYAK